AITARRGDSLQGRDGDHARPPAVPRAVDLGARQPGASRGRPRGRPAFARARAGHAAARLPNQLPAPGSASFALVYEVLTATRRPEKETDDGKEVYQSRHDSYAARLHSCGRVAGRPNAF